MAFRLVDDPDYAQFMMGPDAFGCFMKNMDVFAAFGKAYGFQEMSISTYMSDRDRAENFVRLKAICNPPNQNGYYSMICGIKAVSFNLPYLNAHGKTMMIFFDISITM